MILRLNALRGEYARDAGEIVGDIDAGPASLRGNHGSDIFCLAEADLDDEHAAWVQEHGSLRDEIGVNVEAVFSGEKRLMRLVLDDLTLQIRLLGSAHVRRIAHDEIKKLCRRFASRETGLQEIRLDKVDPILHAVTRSVAVCDFERRRRDVRGRYLRLREFCSERHGDATRACAYVGDS